MSAIPERKNAVAETNILVGDADRSDARASHACLAVGDDSDEGGREDTPLSLSCGTDGQITTNTLLDIMAHKKRHVLS